MIASKTRSAQEPDLAESKANRDVLTDAHSDKLLRVCEHNRDRFAAARF